MGFFCGSSGSCDFDCLEASDCPQPNTAARRAVCSNEGRCRELARAPRIVVSTPAPGEQLASGLSILTVVGSVETAAPSVAVEVGVVGGGGCSTRAADLELVNPEPGRTVAIPFVQDLLLPPQVERIRLEAEVPGARRSLDVRLRADCEDCPQARIERPENDLTLSALRLPVLSGIVDPGAGGGVWRITDGRLQVMDGPLELLGDRFEIRDLPLFQGRNTVEASFDGGRTRCSVSVSAPLLQEELQVVLTWDGEADLDLVLADEDGRLFERTALSSPRTPDQGPGRVEDDFDGFGPELGFASTGPSQLMGIAVESLTGAPASAFVRVLHRRTMLSIPGLGPRRLRSELGDVWLVALLRFDAEGDAELVPIDRVVGPMEIQSLDGPQSW
ncbi:MAG: hypothetical protein AAGD10_03665 [Myxococcota bacterium]